MRKEVIKQMKMIRIFFRSIRDAFKSVGRNFSLSMASILCTTITLIIVAVSIIIAANINYSTKNVEDGMNDIIVYVKKEATEKDIDNLNSELENISEVKEVKHISKEQQKASMQEYSDSFKTILDYLDENPLLDSFVVYVKNIKDMSNVSKEIEKIPNVETVKYKQGIVEEIVSAFDIVEKITIAIVIALILVTVFLISNTIKLTIYSRKNEIEIMRMVGASNGTIKTPFVIEGFILGIIGSIIPICITIYGYVILNNALNGHLFTEVLPLVKPYPFVFSVSLILIIIGALVGMYGSLKAVRKYLKI